MFKSFFFFALPLALIAAPSGEKIVSGNATVERSQGHVQIVQKSDQAIIEWEGFSLDAAETARFVQPGVGSAVLNRVVGGNLSEIYGKMEGNGRVFLVNPQGVMIGKTGVVDCGSFLASALDLENQAFLAGGGYVFEKGEGSVVNEGMIRTGDGPLFLIASDVQNRGILQGAGEQVYLIPGKGVEISSLEHPNVMIRPVASFEKEDLGNPYALAVNRDGEKEATLIRKEMGRVFLEVEEERMAPAFQFVNVGPVPFKNGGLLVEETLDGLQQLRTIIPERLWSQEFAWLVDCARFECAAKDLADHPKCYQGHPMLASSCPSKYYFLHDTVSGEPIRLNDRYEEFLASPFWKTPEALYHLFYLQHNYMKVPR